MKTKMRHPLKKTLVAINPKASPVEVKAVPVIETTVMPTSHATFASTLSMRTMVPFFAAAWPTAEFAGMNIEGAVKLGYRRDLEAIDDKEERLQKYETMVAEGYEEAKAVNKGVYFGIDDVIDPAESRDWIVAGLRSLPPTPPRTKKKRPYVDTW